MIKPQTFFMYDKGIPSRDGANKINDKPKWFDRGECYMLADGTLLEMSWDTRGCWIYAHWLSVKDFYNHTPKQYQSVVLEQF